MKINNRGGSPIGGGAVHFRPKSITVLPPAYSGTNSIQFQYDISGPTVRFQINKRGPKNPTISPTILLYRAPTPVK